MEVRLVRAVESDAEELLLIQRECFRSEYEKYKDDGSPYRLSLERMRGKIAYAGGAYYRIVYQAATVGGIWVYEKEPGTYRMSILYVLPAYQGRGIGQKSLMMVEDLHQDVIHWELDCPDDLPINRHCYEKAGYRLTGKKEVINDRLTLVCYQK